MKDENQRFLQQWISDGLSDEEESLLDAGLALETLDALDRRIAAGASAGAATSERREVGA